MTFKHVEMSKISWEVWCGGVRYAQSTWYICVKVSFCNPKPHPMNLCQCKTKTTKIIQFRRVLSKDIF